MINVHIELRAEMFANLVFKPHGDYIATIEGQVIHSEITGPINLEMIQLYRNAVRPLWLAAAEKGNFCTLAVFHESMLMTLDAIEQFTQATALFAAKFPNYMGIAQVADASVDGRDLMAHIYRTRVYGPLGLRYEIFDTVAEARAWLQDAIAENRKARDMTDPARDLK
jgi:hypothetical protein